MFCMCVFLCVHVHAVDVIFSSKMESRSRDRGMKSSQHGLPARPPIMTVTFSRDTLQRRVDATKPQVLLKPEPKFENVGKLAEKDADPILASLVNYHSRLQTLSGRSFDLVVGKLCHLLKTNGYYLDCKYLDNMNALFCSIRNLIVDLDKSELSRTRLLECLELRAKIWGHDPLDLPKAQPRDLPSPLKPPEVSAPQDQVVFQSQRSQLEGVTQSQRPQLLASIDRYSPIPFPPAQVAPPSPDMVALTNVARSTPFPDDTTDDEEDEEWMTLSEVTYESDSSDEFIHPEQEHDVQDLMMESTTDLDDELSRLLSAKLPDSYKWTVNDGKPVRYTKSYLLNLWNSPFSKQMPPVLRHTISHSDISFVIQRHAFTDPGILFQQGIRDDIHLMSCHLKPDPNMRHRRPTGRSTPELLATVGEGTKQRTMSWPQDAGGRSRLDVQGTGGEGIVQGAVGARYDGTEARMNLAGSATPGAVGRNINEQDVDWRQRRPGSSTSPGLHGPGAGAGRSLGEQAPTAGGDDVSLRPQTSSDWRRSGSTSGILGDGSGRNVRDQVTQGSQDVRSRSPNDWRKPGSTSGILGEGRLGADFVTPSPVLGGGGDSAKKAARPGSSRGRSLSTGSQEGAMKVRFELPDDNKRTGTDRSPLKPVPSSHVLLTPRQIIGDEARDQKTIPPLMTPQSSSDLNNNGFHPIKESEDVFETISSKPAQQPMVPTFKEVFKAVIEKGITTGAPGPAAKAPIPAARTPSPTIKSPPPQGYVPLSATYKPPGAASPDASALSSAYKAQSPGSCEKCGSKGGVVEQSLQPKSPKSPKSPVGGGYRAGWTAQGDW